MEVNKAYITYKELIRIITMRYTLSFMIRTFLELPNPPKFGCFKITSFYQTDSDFFSGNNGCRLKHKCPEYTLLAKQ